MRWNPGLRTIDGELVHGAALAEALPPEAFEKSVDVKTAASFLGISPSLVYAYVERKQIPHFRMMGRAIRFRLSGAKTSACV